MRSALARSGQAFEQLSRSTTLSARRPTGGPCGRRLAGRRDPSARRPRSPKPITIGLGEPFSTSITVAFAFALLLGLPLLLWEAWAFLAPAVAPADRRAVRPLLALAPLLLVAGVAFAYLVVLPPAVRFLQGFNDGAFDALVQARDYYHFELVTMLALGAIFQIPVVILVLGRAGLLSSSTLRSQTPLRDRRARHPRRPVARHGPRDHRARDDPPHRALRAQHRAPAHQRTPPPPTAGMTIDTSPRGGASPVLTLPTSSRSQVDEDWLLRAWGG